MPRFASIGTQLQLYNGSAYSTVAEVQDITLPDLKSDTYDATNMSSPGGYEEALPTILRTGELGFGCNYLPTDATQNAATGLISYWKNRTLTNIKLIFSDSASTTWTLPGYVTNIKGDLKLKDAGQLNVSFKVSGEPSLS